VSEVDVIIEQPLKAELYAGFDLNSCAINAPIEPGILPVCEALNSLPSVHTLWSCEGHAVWADLPYVAFIASQDLAFRVNLLLESQAGSDDGLHYNWRLIGSFRNDGSLQYILETSDARLSGWRRALFPLPLFGRRAMNRELQRLADLIATLNKTKRNPLDSSMGRFKSS
jgi:hypothetical protein